MPIADDSLLILVRGDPFSKIVEKEAREAGFKGQVMKLPMKEAIHQGTPLPLLFEGRESLGPDELAVYFKHKKKDKSGRKK